MVKIKKILFKKNDRNHTPSSPTFPECYKRPRKFLHDMHVTTSSGSIYTDMF